MCNWDDNTEVLVHIPAHLSHTGKARIENVLVDSCISSIIKALNESLDEGIHTTGCCCGHGKMDGSILLCDGRELIIKET